MDYTELSVDTPTTATVAYVFLFAIFVTATLASFPISQEQLETRQFTISTINDTDSTVQSEGVSNFVFKDNLTEEDKKVYNSVTRGDHSHVTNLSKSSVFTSETVLVVDGDTQTKTYFESKRNQNMLYLLAPVIFCVCAVITLVKSDELLSHVTLIITAAVLVMITLHHFFT